MGGCVKLSDGGGNGGLSRLRVVEVIVVNMEPLALANGKTSTI